MEREASAAYHARVHPLSGPVSSPERCFPSGVPGTCRPLSPGRNSQDQLVSKLLASQAWDVRTGAKTPGCPAWPAPGGCPTLADLAAERCEITWAHVCTHPASVTAFRPGRSQLRQEWLTQHDGGRGTSVTALRSRQGRPLALNADASFLSVSEEDTHFLALTG